MLVRPIPLQLLIDDVEYFERIDTERENIFKEPILIRNCRVVFGQQRKINDFGEEDTNNIFVYFCFIHSKPFIIPKNGDRIKYENVEYVINSIDIYKNLNRKIHHIKIGVN